MSIPVNFDAIVERLKACNNVAIDDHMSFCPQLFQQLLILKGVAVPLRGEHVVAVDPHCEFKSYSLNSLYIGTDGMVHVSRNQVGCVTDGDLNASVAHVTLL